MPNLNTFAVGSYVTIINAGNYAAATATDVGAMKVISTSPPDLRPAGVVDSASQASQDATIDAQKAKQEAHEQSRLRPHLPDGGTAGQRPTVQADGTIAYETPIALTEYLTPAELEAGADVAKTINAATFKAEADRRDALQVNVADRVGVIRDAANAENTKWADELAIRNLFDSTQSIGPEVDSFFQTDNGNDSTVGGKVIITAGSLVNTGASGPVAIGLDSFTLAQRSEPYKLAWFGGFDFDGSPDQESRVEFVADDPTKRILSLDATADAFDRTIDGTTFSTYQWMRPTAVAIIDATAGAVVVSLAFTEGGPDLGPTAGTVRVQSSGIVPEIVPDVEQYVDRRNPFLESLGWVKQSGVLAEAGSKRFSIGNLNLIRWSAATNEFQSFSYAAANPISFRVADRNGYVTTGLGGEDLTAPVDQIQQSWGYDDNGTLADMVTVATDTNDGVIYRMYVLPQTGEFIALLPQSVVNTVANAFYRVGDETVTLPAILNGAVFLGFAALDEDAGNFTYSTAEGRFPGQTTSSSAAVDTSYQHTTDATALTPAQMTEGGIVGVGGGLSYKEYRILTIGTNWTTTTKELIWSKGTAENLDPNNIDYQIGQAWSGQDLFSAFGSPWLVSPGAGVEHPLSPSQYTRYRLNGNNASLPEPGAHDGKTIQFWNNVAGDSGIHAVISGALFSPKVKSEIGNIELPPGTMVTLISDGGRWNMAIERDTNYYFFTGADNDGMTLPTGHRMMIHNDTAGAKFKLTQIPVDGLAVTMSPTSTEPFIIEQAIPGVAEQVRTVDGDFESVTIGLENRGKTIEINGNNTFWNVGAIATGENSSTTTWIKEECYAQPSTDPYNIGNAGNFLDEITAAQLATLPAGPHFRWTAPENVTLTTLTVARLGAATNTIFSWATSTGESGTTSTTEAGTVDLDLGSIVLAQGDTIDFTIDTITGGQMQLATESLAIADGWTALQDFSGFAVTSYLTNNISGFSGGGDDLIIRTNKTGPPQIIDREANTCTDTTQAFVDTLTLKPSTLATDEPIIVLAADNKPVAYKARRVTADTTLDLADVPATEGISYYVELGPDAVLTVPGLASSIMHAGPNFEILHLESTGTAGEVRLVGNETITSGEFYREFALNGTAVSWTVPHTGEFVINENLTTATNNAVITTITNTTAGGTTYTSNLNRLSSSNLENTATVALIEGDVLSIDALAAGGTTSGAHSVRIRPVGGAVIDPNVQAIIPKTAAITAPAGNSTVEVYDEFFTKHTIAVNANKKLVLGAVTEATVVLVPGTVDTFQITSTGPNPAVTFTEADITTKYANAVQTQASAGTQVAIGGMGFSITTGGTRQLMVRVADGQGNRAIQFSTWWSGGWNDKRIGNQSFSSSWSRFTGVVYSFTAAGHKQVWTMKDLNTNEVWVGTVMINDSFNNNVFSIQYFPGNLGP